MLIRRSSKNAGIGVIMNRTMPSTPSGTERSRHGMAARGSAGAFNAFTGPGLRVLLPEPAAGAGVGNSELMAGTEEAGADIGVGCSVPFN